MIKSKDELLSAIREKFTDDSSDETLSILEDITDTFDDLESRSSDTTDWKKKYEENDESWRKKYKERFFEPSSNPDDDLDDTKKKKPKTFEDLFN